MQVLLRAAAALSAFAVACGGAPQAAPAPDEASAPPAATVDVVNVAFKPSTLTVLRSTTVTWVNRDEGVRHTATSGAVGTGAVPGVSKAKPGRPDGVFDGDLADAGAHFAHTFTNPGTYEYFCEIHPSMVATVVVE